MEAQDQEQFTGFNGTEYRYPLLYAIRGYTSPTQISSVSYIEGRDHIDQLWSAELQESMKKDKDSYFVTDDAFRSMCLGLNESTNGWVLLIGLRKDAEFNNLVNHLESKKLRIFAAGSSARILRENKVNFKDLGPRDTGIIYFGQLLVRYALIYGRELGGAPHEVSHIIEEYAPGVILLLGIPNKIEKTLIQGLLGIGVPVVILNSGHGLTGHTIIVETPLEMVEKIWELPNIRARYVKRATSDVPVPSGPIFRNEVYKEDEIKYRVCGSKNSFIVSKTSEVEKDLVLVLGSLDTASGFSLLVEIGNPAADPTVTLWVDAILLRVSKYAKGIKIKSIGGGNHELLLTKEAWSTGFSLQHFGNLIITELRNEFPSIGPVKVSIILDTKEEARLQPEVEAYNKKRDKLLQEANEDDLKSFYGCTRCRSFSLAHACTVTPERPAQCSKPWYMLKAYAVLAPESTYYPCQIIQKGECLDPIKGEYEGVNASTMVRTRGKTTKVYLHSIFDFPHTACSCFQNIAFYIPEVDGIAVMDRGYKGSAPGGWTWTKLANLVAGRQCKDGVASIGAQYLRSPKFLQADGGYERVVWMSGSLNHYAKDVIPELYRSKIATEMEAVTLEELKRFLKRD